MDQTQINQERIRQILESQIDDRAAHVGGVLLGGRAPTRAAKTFSEFWPKYMKEERASGRNITSRDAMKEAGIIWRRNVAPASTRKAPPRARKAQPRTRMARKTPMKRKGSGFESFMPSLFGRHEFDPSMASPVLVSDMVEGGAFFDTVVDVFSQLPVKKIANFIGKTLAASTEPEEVVKIIEKIPEEAAKELSITPSTQVLVPDREILQEALKEALRAEREFDRPEYVSRGYRPVQRKRRVAPKRKIARRGTRVGLKKGRGGVVIGSELY